MLVKVLCQSKGACGKPEFLIAEISTCDNSKILLAVVYRSPHCGYLTEFFNVFIDLSAGYKHFIIFGDFNADLGSVKYDSTKILSFVETANLSFRTNLWFRMLQLIIHKLHLHDLLCIIDDVDKLITYYQRDACYLFAHDLIGIKYKIKIKRFNGRKLNVRDFRLFVVDNFLDDLGTYDWDVLYRDNNVDGKILMLNKVFTDCYDKHAPIRSIQPKHLPAPGLRRISDLQWRQQTEREQSEGGIELR